MRIYSGAIALLAVAALAACGSPKPAQQDGQVASISGTTPASTSSAPAGAEDSGRPRLRLDSSAEESTRLWVAYKVCLKEHGAQDVDTGTGAGVAAADGSMTTDRAATAACAGKMPLPPIELDPAKNPNFSAQWNDYVQCERKNGILMHVTAPGQEDWDAGAGNSIDVNKWERVTEACTQQTFGAKNAKK